MQRDVRFDGLRFRNNILEIRVHNGTEWRWRPQTSDGYSGKALAYFNGCMEGLHGSENESIAAAWILSRMRIASS